MHLRDFLLVLSLHLGNKVFLGSLQGLHFELIFLIQCLDVNLVNVFEVFEVIGELLLSALMQPDYFVFVLQLIKEVSYVLLQFALILAQLSFEIAEFSICRVSFLGYLMDLSIEGANLVFLLVQFELKFHALLRTLLSEGVLELLELVLFLGKGFINLSYLALVCHVFELSFSNC